MLASFTDGLPADAGGGTAGSINVGVGEGVVTKRMKLASESFIVVASQTRPGVMFPSSVSEGSTLRCKRKRNALVASADKSSIDENRCLIDGLLSRIVGENAL